MSASPARTVEAFRPAFHYSASNTWLNDPNGLIFHGGLYHLYYQNNPLDNVWGNMSWGHATSADLLGWTEHPVAITFDEHEDIFSGSIVCDRFNTSGFGTETAAPLVAIYTSAYKPASEHHGTQAQSLAYSLDGGYSWTKHAQNPVLTRNSPDFRDPKVFWYEGESGGYWVMVAVEALDYQVVLYKSADLLDWEYLSSFGPANATTGIWECPDLFPLPLDGDPDNVKWVLTVNLNPGGPNKGSAGQYFVGSFDGTRFVSETTVTEGLKDAERLNDYQWLDWGRDYYAAVSFADAPDDRRLMIGWMNNWDYANQIPTAPWRSPMSLAREITLAGIEGQPRLIQRVATGPSGAPEPLSTCSRPAGPLPEGTTAVPGAAGRVQHLTVSFEAGSAQEFGVVVRGNGSEGTRIGINPALGTLFVDRRNSGAIGFHEAFPSIDAAPLRPVDGSYTLEIYVDHCSVEVFAAGGQVTMTQLVFPDPDSQEVSLFAAGGTAVLGALEISTYA